MAGYMQQIAELANRYNESNQPTNQKSEMKT